MTAEELKTHPSVLRLYLSKRDFKRQGDGYLTNCVNPKHPDKNPSCRLFLDKDGKTWLFKCWSCNITGDVIKFVQLTDGVDFSAAKKTVADFCGLEEKVTKVFRPVADNPKTTLTLDQYKKFEDALEKSEDARLWLAKRGINYETARRLHFGYSRDVGQLCGDDDIRRAGWLVLPCIREGRVDAVKYRSLLRKAFTKLPGMVGASLFGSEEIDSFLPVYVCEGELDAAVLLQAGFRAVSLPNATTRLTPEMREQLKQASEIILAGDTDSAGTEAMNRLWKELGDKTYLLTWPTAKDANEFFLKECDGNVEKFKTSVNELTAKARSIPMPGVYSLVESLTESNRTTMADHPNRLHFPWPSVDKMANILPGSVVSIFATNTGMGKTTLVMAVLLEEAKRGDVILNYSAELGLEEYSNLVTAYVLRKDRNKLVTEDYEKAASFLRHHNVRFYIGRNPDLATANEVLDLIEAGVQKFNASVVVLDHLHMVCRNETDTIKAQENAMQRIVRMSNKYNLKFIVVGQPRKANQQNKGKVVHVTDGKGSESFTSDAHVVMAIHRNTIKNIDPANPPDEPYEPLTQIHLLKGRSQGEGKAYAELMFMGKLAAFSEIAYNDSSETENLYSL